VPVRRVCRRARPRPATSSAAGPCGNGRNYSVVTAVSLMWLAPAPKASAWAGFRSSIPPASTPFSMCRGSGRLDRLFLPRLPRERERPPGAGARRMGTPAANIQSCVLRRWTAYGRPRRRRLCRQSPGRGAIFGGNDEDPMADAGTDTNLRPRRSGGSRCGFTASPEWRMPASRCRTSAASMSTRCCSFCGSLPKKLIPALRCPCRLRAGRPVALREGTNGTWWRGRLVSRVLRVGLRA